MEGLNGWLFGERVRMMSHVRTYFERTSCQNTREKQRGGKLYISKPFVARGGNDTYIDGLRKFYSLSTPAFPPGGEIWGYHGCNERVNFLGDERFLGHVK